MEVGTSRVKSYSKPSVFCGFGYSVRQNLQQRVPTSESTLSKGDDYSRVSPGSVQDGDGDTLTPENFHDDGTHNRGLIQRPV